MMYEAELSICCVDGSVEIIQSSDPKRLFDYLRERDHEGSSVSMVIRDTPEQTRHIEDPEQVYRELEALTAEVPDEG